MASKLTTGSEPKPVQVHFDDAKVNAMLTLLKVSPFPTKPPLPAAKKWDLGVDVEFLAAVKAKFETQFSARALEQKANRYQNYVVRMEEDGVELDVHFVHAKSARSDAIPLLMLHGWPGTFILHARMETRIHPRSRNFPRLSQGH